jgi:hypothetical protein
MSSARRIEEAPRRPAQLPLDRRPGAAASWRGGVGEGPPKPKRRNSSAGPLLALSLVAALLAPPTSAGASYDPIGTGTTTLKLDKGLLVLLKQDGIKLSAKAPAKLRAGKLTLPVFGGKFDPTFGKGTLETEGILTFQNSRGKVPLKQIAVKTAHAPLIAKLGGSQLKVATAGKVAVSRKGFGSEVNATKLKLSAKVITRLNKKLRPPTPLVAGQALGSLSASSEPATTTLLPSGVVELVPDPAFVAKMNSLFVSLNPISPTELAPGPLFKAPILLGSAIAPSARSGLIMSGGAIEALQLGAGQVFIKESWLDLTAGTISAELDLEPTPGFPGKQPRAPILSFAAPGAASADAKARMISLTGTNLVLGQPLVDAFNKAFAEGRPVFMVGEPFGSLSFTAQGQ